MNDKCKGVFGFLFGHSFFNIFDDKTEYQSLNDDSSSVKWSHIVMNHKQPILKSESIYVKSVCSRCGKEIKKETNNEQEKRS